MPVYTFNSTNAVAVGQATKKSHYDRLFGNIMALKQGDEPLNWLRVSASGDTGGVNYLGSANTGAFLNIAATFAVSAAVTTYGVRIAPVLSNSNSGISKYGVDIVPAITQGAGTSPALVGLRVSPTFTATGSAITTVAAAIQADGFTAPAGTVAGASLYVNGPTTGATNNFALRVTGSTSLSSFDGAVGINTPGGGGITLDVRPTSGNSVLQLTGSGIDQLQLVASTAGNSILNNLANASLGFATNNQVKWRILAGGNLTALNNYAIHHTGDTGFLDFGGGSTTTQTNGAFIRLHGVNSAGSAPGAVQLAPGATGANADIYLYNRTGGEALKISGADGLLTSTVSAAGSGWIFNSTHADGSYILIQRSGSNIGGIGTADSMGQGSDSDANLLVLANAMLELEASTEVRSKRIYDTGTTGLSGSRLPVVIDTDGHMGSDTSSRRTKLNIEGMSLAAARRATFGMAAQTFRRSSTMFEPYKEVGLIAEDVLAVAPEIVCFGRDGQPAGLDYLHGWVYLLPVVQDHEARIAALERENQALRAAVGRMH